jgi:hypothetical protein
MQNSETREHGGPVPTKNQVATEDLFTASSIQSCRFVNNALPKGGNAAILLSGFTRSDEVELSSAVNKLCIRIHCEPLKIC